MANITISPNMSMPVPVPGVDPGPDWANNITACFSIVDSHNHTPGSGNQITPSALNINSDLSFLVNNAVSVRSIRFYPNPSALSGVLDLGCIYEAGVDLYYNDGNGNQIRITQSGSVAGSSGTITGLPSGTASAAYSSLQGTFIFQQATSTAANLDAASYVLRYPGSYPTPSGNYISLQAPTSLSTGYALTMPALPAQQNIMTLDSSGNISAPWNVDNVTLQVTSNLLNVKAIPALTVDTAQIVDGAVTLPKLAPLSYQLSSSCGNFTSSTFGIVLVTNLSVTITCTGRPMFVTLVNDGGSVASSFAAGSGAGGVNPQAQIYLFRDAVAISSSQVSLRAAPAGGTVSSVIAPACGSLNMFDTPGAGTYTYTVGLQAEGDATQVSLTQVKLLAYEI